MSIEDTGLSIGQNAPNWSANVMGQEGQSKLSHDDLKGQNYIIYFYPKDNTPGCTTQACDFRDQMDRLSRTWTNPKYMCCCNRMQA